MRVKLVFSAEVKDTEDMRGLREQIGMCFEKLGDVRLVGIFQVEDGAELKSERGKYGKVMLTDGGYEELTRRFGKGRADELIDELSWKLYQKNYRYADHFAVIVEWEEAARRGRLSGSDIGEACAQSFDVDEFFRANLDKGINS